MTLDMVELMDVNMFVMNIFHNLVTLIFNEDVLKW